MKNSIVKLIQILLLVICAWSVQSVHAQKEIDTSFTAIDSGNEAYDDEVSEIPDELENNEKNTPILPIQRHIVGDTIQHLKAEPAFEYMVYLDSMLKAYQYTIDHQPPPPPETVPEDNSIFDYQGVRFIFYAAAIALAGFVLYRLFFGQGVLTRNRKEEVPDIELEETPDETDLEKSLRIALNRQDYRLAVRYLFLQTLYSLGDKGVVQLSSEKTNYQYLVELSSKKYANQFAQLSLQYEYVWFGNFPINEVRFSAIQQQHQQFLKQL